MLSLAQTAVSAIVRAGLVQSTAQVSRLTVEKRHSDDSDDSGRLEVRVRMFEQSRRDDDD